MRVDSLAEAGLLVEDGSAESTGGRRATYLRFAHDSGVVLVADLDVTVARLAVTDLAGGVLAASTVQRSMAEGPSDYLDWMVGTLWELLEGAGRSASELRGVGVGLPGPVEHATGRPIAPPSMPGWDRFPVAEVLAERFEVPVVVDNDVNLMAWGEYTALWRHEASNFLFIKLAEAGIGCGIVAAGRIHHGDQGSAGAIGHIRVPGYEDWVCRCGNSGCLGAVVGGEALAKRLRQRGHDLATGGDVAEQALAGALDAIQEVRVAGRAVGEVMAGIVNFFNPEVIVVGGDVARAHEQLIAGLREVVYQRCLPLATRDLTMVPSSLGNQAGIAGAAAMTIDRVLAPNLIDELVSGAPVESAG
jgi:predicted NBD/HSP70 family sugar kinase